MVILGLNPASIMGLIYIFLAILYIIFSRSLGKSLFRQVLNPTLYNFQSLVMPSILIIISLTLLFQGWRLDPILQFSFFLKEILLIYILGKDMIMFKLIKK